MAERLDQHLLGVVGRIGEENRGEVLQEGEIVLEVCVVEDIGGVLDDIHCLNSDGGRSLGVDDEREEVESLGVQNEGLQLFLHHFSLLVLDEVLELVDQVNKFLLVYTHYNCH